MSRVMTFSRVFPSYHPRKGEPTYFVEKVVRSLHEQGHRPSDIDDSIFSTEMYYICEAKYHTIRAGHRWKVGDKFSPRVWSGKPYQSKQIVIAPDIEVKKVWDIKIYSDEDCCSILINDNYIGRETSSILARNDGLLEHDMYMWFNKSIEGQIICWNENIEY